MTRSTPLPCDPAPPAHPPALPDAAAGLWSHVFEPDGADPARDRVVLPTGTVELVFTVGGPLVHAEDERRTALPRVYVAGQRTRPVTPLPRGTREVVVVSLQPWALGALLPAGLDARDTYPALDDVRPRALDAPLEEAFASATTPAARRAAALETVTRLTRASRDPAPAFLRRAVARLGVPGAPSVQALADELGLTRRHLSRAFARWVGLSPKLYGRIRRFQGALAESRAPGSSLAAVAARWGFVDQAHLSHEVRHFSGLTPRQLPPDEGREQDAARSPHFECVYL